VGHINHSAIYVVISYGVLLSIYLAKKIKFSYTINLFTLVSMPIFLLAFYIYSSRVFIALFLLMSFTFCVFWLRSKVDVWKIVLVIAFIVTLLIILFEHTPHSFDRILHWINSDFSELTYRDKINNFSYYAMQLNPFLGVGLANYHTVSLTDVIPLIVEDQGSFNPELFIESSHAHSLYYSYLVHGGVILFSVMVFFWLYVIRFIISSLGNKKIMAGSANVVYSSMFVVTSILISGIYNSTLHHENALLTFIVLGLFFSSRRQYEKNIEKI